MDSQRVFLLRWTLLNMLGYQVIVQQPTMLSWFTIGIRQRRTMWRRHRCVWVV